MKLKRSYVFLISLISIFLLLSLSAVSAAGDVDNQLSDSSAEMIDDVNGVGGTNDNYLTDSNILSDGDSGDEGGDDPVADSIPTTVESNDESYIYGNTIKFNVSLKDNESNPIAFTQDNIRVYTKNSTAENYTQRNFTIDNESKIVLKFASNRTLPAGDYFVNITFIGNETYAASETVVNLNIAKADATINASDVKVNLGSDIVIPINMSIGNKSLNFNASYMNVTYNGEEINFTKVTGGIKLLNFTQEIGDYSILIKYDSTNCNPCEATVAVRILANNTIKADDSIKVNINDYNVTIPFVITNTNITTTYDEETEENVTNVNVTNVTVAPGDLKLYLKYFNGTENITEEITGFDLSGEPGNYTISFTNDKVDNGELTIVFGEGTFNETNKTIKLTVFRNAKIEVVNAVADYQYGNFTFKLFDADTNAVLSNTTVTVSGIYFYSNENGTSARPSQQFTSDENGIIFINNLNLYNGLDFSFFVYNFTALQAGKYNLTFKATNSSMDLNVIKEITVNPVKVKIVASNYKEEIGNGKKFAFKLVNAATNQPIKLTSMQLKVKTGSTTSTYNTTSNLTGEASFSINLLAGTYPVTIVTNSANVVKTSVDKTITVVKKQGVLAASSRTIKYGSEPTAIIRFTDKKTGKAVVGGVVKVRLYTTSTKYVDLAFSTNKTGYIKFNAALSVGKHKMIISSLDNNYSASSITRYVTVKKTTGKFSASKVTTYYNSGKLYKVKLTNTVNKNAMYGSNILIKVYTSKTRFYKYIGTTAANGIVQFKINYKPGTYKVVISSNDKGYTAKSVTSQIKVTKSPIKIAPTSLKVKKGQYFKVKVTSTKSKKVLSNVKVKIKVYNGKSYKIYTKKTNKKGIASLKITQKVGKHKVVLSPGSPAYYSAKALTKTLTVTK